MKMKTYLACTVVLVLAISTVMAQSRRTDRSSDQSPPPVCSTDIGTIVFFNPPAYALQMGAEQNEDGQLSIILYTDASVIGRPDTGWEIPDHVLGGFSVSSNPPFVAAVVRGDLVFVDVFNCEG